MQARDEDVQGQLAGDFWKCGSRWDVEKETELPIGNSQLEVELYGHRSLVN
jgi:hypothetical protein